MRATIETTIEKWLEQVFNDIFLLTYTLIKI